MNDTPNNSIDKPQPEPVNLPAVAEVMPPVRGDMLGYMLSSAEGYATVSRACNALAKGGLVPAHFAKNPVDLVIVYDMARRQGREFMEIAQALYMVHGRPGWSSSYLIGRANASGIFADRLAFEVTGTGLDMVATCIAKLKSGREVRESVTMKTAIDDGWTSNKKYQTMPDTMLKYRAATKLFRFYCPEVLHGLPSVEEIETLAPEPARAVIEASATERANLDAFAGTTNTTAVDAAVERSGTTKPQTVDAAKPAAQPVPQIKADDEPTTPAQTTAEPAKVPTDIADVQNEAQYVAYANAWIASTPDAQGVANRWNHEKPDRNRLSVSKENRTALQNAVETKVAQLTGQKTA